MNADIDQIEPKIGEGIYVAKDVSRILHLNYEKTYRWLAGYWSAARGGLSDKVNYTFGEAGSRAINFLSLIEFYTFYKLREKV